MEQVSNTIKTIDHVLGDVVANPYVSASLAIFFILYAGLAAPKLPKMISKLFDYSLFKILILFGILIINRYNPTVALIIAIAFFISLQTFTKDRLQDFMGQVSNYTNMLKRTITFQDAEPTKEEMKEEHKVAQQAAPQIGYKEEPEKGPMMHEPPVNMVDTPSHDSKVSGLSSRTDEYESPQGGLGPLQGYDGPHVGAEYML